MSMEDFENPYQTLKLEYQELINECRQTKLDNAERFQSYQEKVLKELAQILKERVEFEENWERKLRESDIGRRGLPKHIQWSIGVPEKTFIETLDSSSTLAADDLCDEPEELDSDDESEERALNQLYTFHSRKAIKRRQRFRFNDFNRQKTLESLDVLIRETNVVGTNYGRVTSSLVEYSNDDLNQELSESNYNHQSVTQLENPQEFLVEN
ncbi:hypothetical protein HDV02_001276 [Globomyces sp. JEL0801]|nr:hypothetical protein HDV02_001276 [Globomyces sp. JEL0801]